MRIIVTTTLFILASLISACGGGGTTITTTVPSIVTYQLKDAYVNYITNTQSLPFTVTANYQGQTATGSGTLSQDALKSGTFEGKPALQKTSTMTGIMTGNGQTIPLATTSVSYVDSNYSPLGDVSTGYGIVTGSINIPTTAIVGSTGVWYTENFYSSSSRTTLAGSLTVSYVLEADNSPNTALLKIIQNIMDTSNRVVASGSINFRMTPSGTLTRLSETGVVNGLTITIQY